MRYALCPLASYFFPEVSGFTFRSLIPAISLTRSRISAGAWAIFFQGSLLLFIFTRSTLWGPINAVSNDLYNGTLEYLTEL